MPTTSSRFLRVPLAAGLLVVAATPAERVSGPFDYETKEIGPGVYGFFEKRLNPIVSSNIIAVIGTDAVLLFDTGHHPTITRRILGDVKRLTSKPVKYVVVSHWHDDHWAANGDVAATFPGVKVIAHDFTAKLLESRSKDFRGEACRKDAASGLPSLKERLANGKLPDGTPLPDATKQRLTNFVEALEGQIPECDAMVYRGVDQRMSDSLTIDLGGRRVKLEFLGRGNTAGDVVALLPESKTLLTGDLVVYPFPFATQPYITEWAKVLRNIEAMDVERIVPGHGPVFSDKQYVRDVAETLESIASQARAAYKPGMTVDSLRAKIDLSQFADRFSKGDRFIRANFDAQMKGSAIDRMWQELTGEWKPEGD
jgi:glyoxylase-like metal-dependent hydrolase (beta-lactamase superfamily II)